MTTTRLQKVLAAAGVASRRKAEEMIEQGKVKVNGRVIKELGTKVDPRRDKIEVEGRQLSAPERTVTLLMNKPRGVVCTVSDPEGRETIIDLVKGLKMRLFPVGRLDYATSGALLITNDGDLAYALTHPKHDVEKTYLIKAQGDVSDAALEQWRKGVDIGDDKPTRPAVVFKVEQKDNYTWFEATIKEGRNRQIRRMGEATGININKLKRVVFAGLSITGLRPGQYRELTEKELDKLKRDYINPVNKQKQSSQDAPDFNVPGQKEKSAKKGKNRGWSAGSRTPKPSQSQGDVKKQSNPRSRRKTSPSKPQK